MAEFHVYAIGDSEFLAEVMGAAATVFGYDGYTDLIKVGMLIGVLLLGFKTLLNQKFELHHLLLVFIMYGLFFQNTDTKTWIHDEITGTATDIDNLPIGFAATASLVSTASSQLTKIFETAYTIPGITTGGYLDLPKILLNSRKIGLNTANANSTNQGDIERTIMNYLSDCTFTALDMNLGSVTKQDLMKSSDLITDMKFDSPVYTTMQFLPGDPTGGQERYCGTPPSTYTGTDGNGYEELKTYIDTNLESDWAEVLKARLGINDPFGATGEIQVAIDELIPGTSVNAYGYMKQALMKELMRRAETYDSITYGDAVASITMAEATEQRNFQWSMEQSMFIRIMMPMMTFIESLVYAITPLAAFLMMLGTAGIMLAAKYLYLLVWVALWKPVIAIVNLYASMKMKGHMTDYSVIGDANSILGMPYLENTLADWIGVAGMLTASTPAITLMLIYGSAITATHLASRIQGGDHIDERNAAPDLMKNNATVTHMGQGQIHPTFGYNQHGALEASSNMSIDQGTLNSIVSSANAFKNTQSRALTSATNNTFQELNKAGFSHSSSSGLNESVTGSGTETWSTIKQHAETLSNRHSLGKEDSTTVAAAMTLALSGDRTGALKMLDNLSVNSSSTGVGARGAVIGEARKTSTDKQGINFDELRNDVVQYGKGHDAALQNAVKADFANTDQNIFDHSNVASTQNSYSDATTNLAAAEKTFNEAAGLSKSIGLGFSGKTHNLADRQIRDGNYEKLMSLAVSDGVYDRYTAQLNRIQQGNWYGGNDQMQRAVAANHAIMDALSSEDGVNTYSNLLSQYTPMAGTSLSDQLNNTSNSGLQDQNVGLKPTDTKQQARSELGSKVQENTIYASDTEGRYMDRSLDAEQAANENRGEVSTAAIKNQNDHDIEGTRKFLQLQGQGLVQNDDLVNQLYNAANAGVTNLGRGAIGALGASYETWISDVLSGNGQNWGENFRKETQELYDKAESYYTHLGTTLSNGQINFLASVESGRYTDAFAAYHSLSDSEKDFANDIAYTNTAGKEFIALTNRDENASIERVENILGPASSQTPNVSIQVK